MAKEALMVGERFFGLPMLGYLLENLKMGHEPSPYLIQGYQPPQFDFGSAFS